jgi:hypothetical protein
MKLLRRTIEEVLVEGKGLLQFHGEWRFECGQSIQDNAGNAEPAHTS